MLRRSRMRRVLLLKPTNLIHSRLLITNELMQAKQISSIMPLLDQLLNRGLWAGLPILPELAHRIRNNEQIRWRVHLLNSLLKLCVSQHNRRNQQCPHPN